MGGNQNCIEWPNPQEVERWIIVLFLDHIIQLEPAASSVAPTFIPNSDSDAIATTDSPTTLLETTTKNDQVIFFSLKPEEEATELSTTSKDDDILHDDFSLHEHDEHDVATNAGGNLIKKSL